MSSFHGGGPSLAGKALTAPSEPGTRGCGFPMEPPRHLGRFFGRLVEALKGLARKLPRSKPPAMIGPLPVA
jgi:hypothetical protein